MTNSRFEADPAAQVRGNSLREPYLLATIIFITVVIAASYAMLQLRAGAIERAHIASSNTAASITQSLDGMFETIDVGLHASSEEIARHIATGTPNANAINSYLLRTAGRLPRVAYVRATDAVGDVVYGEGLPPVTTNLADRDFFRTLQSKPDHGLYIASPVLAKISKQYVVTLARRVDDRTGRFVGTVYASIYVDELRKLLEQFNVGAHGSIALRDADAGLVARYVAGSVDPIPIGSHQLSSPFAMALRHDPNQGVYLSDATSLDPTVRYYTYRRSQKFGYLVNVGVVVEEELDSWWRQVGVVVALVTALGISLAAFLYQSRQSRRRQIDHARKLAQAEHQHRDLLQNLQTGVVVHAPDTHITFANAKASELLGLTAEQMQGKTAIDPTWCFIDLQGRTMAPSDYPVSVVLRSGQPILETVLGVRIPGRVSTTWLQVSAFPERDATGGVQHVVVNFYDMTKRKEAEDRWKFALEGSGDGVWDIDMETGQAECSRRYYEMLGYAEGEIPNLHQTWLEHVHPEDRARTQTDIAHQIAMPAGAFATEYRMRCKDGSYKWLLARGMVVSRDAQGKPLRMVGTNADISQLKAAEQNAWTQANFDALTGLPNRRLFYDRLEMKLRQSERTSEVLALLFIDLDRFKEVNDTLGHDVGDALLVEAAQRIKKCVRDYDTVARLGGDEFTVILADQHQSFDTGTVAQKIIERLSEVFQLGKGEAYVSASIGIALFPSDAQTVNELIKNADQAMYVAKNAGRRRFCFFTKDMQESALERMRLVSDLRKAVAENQFEVYYQPIVCLRTGGIYKAEALVRWNHPQRGVVSPAQFISIAEEVGVIHEIGDSVFMQAAAQVAVWRSKYDARFQISVNKSPVQFEGETRGHGRWIQRLNELQIPGASIVIEITEGVLMDNSARVAESLIQFRDAGIQVAIDDFGTGYSSLAYLKKFDIDYLKIDQSFVRNLSPQSMDRTLCETIVGMAHSLGLRVIAEGVETAAQRDLLQAMGCDYAQGYLFARPLPAAQMEALLSAASSRD